MQAVSRIVIGDQEYFGAPTEPSAEGPARYTVIGLPENEDGETVVALSDDAVTEGETVTASAYTVVEVVQEV